uniref:Uncharacterized protein n=1 Tax=Pipistrellus kuhlii TaxID=59472 RepID=A0A7J8A8Y6_PIPKU|nr:hypothetical protein mPipKuh1_008982 [Pipistrellus kuhlii]
MIRERLCPPPPISPLLLPLLAAEAAGPWPSLFSNGPTPYPLVCVWGAILGQAGRGRDCGRLGHSRLHPVHPLWKCGTWTSPMLLLPLCLPLQKGKHRIGLHHSLSHAIFAEGRIMLPSCHLCKRGHSASLARPSHKALDRPTPPVWLQTSPPLPHGASNAFSRWLSRWTSGRHFS